MKRLLIAVLLTMAVGAPLWAQGIKIEQIAARVNAEIVLKSDIDRELELRRQDLAEQVDQKKIDQPTAQKMMDDYKETVLRDLIDRRLLMQLAKEAGLSAELDVYKTMEQLREERKFATMDELERAIIKDYGDLDEFKEDILARVLTQKVIDHEVYGHIVVTQEEERKFYEAHKTDFDKPAGVRLSEIVVFVDRRLPDQVATQRKKAEDALAALKKGDDFAEVAKKFSEYTDAASGGDMGYIQADLDDHIKMAIANLNKNQFTEIIDAPDAFEIYKLTDKHNGGILTFELAEKYIYSEMMEDIAPPKIREFLGKLREDGFVDVKEGFTDTGALKPTKVKKSASSKD